VVDRLRIALRRRLATNARAMRVERGWTQEEAAEKVGCSVQALQRLERAAAAFTIDFIGLFAAAYQVDVLDLLAPAGPWRQPKPGRPPSEQAATAGEPRARYKRRRKRKR
jgi:transcriptional regulator with XRE-family HTH domain